MRYLSSRNGIMIIFLASLVVAVATSSAMAGDPPKPCSLGNRIDPETKTEYTGSAELGISGGSTGAPRFGWSCDLKTLADLVEADVNMQTASGERAPLNFADIKIGRNARTGFTTVTVDFYPLCAPKCPADYSPDQFVGRYAIFFNPSSKSRQKAR